MRGSRVVVAMAAAVAVSAARPALAQYTFCQDDGACAFPETCSTCPDDCGSCDVRALSGQLAKYVDGSCSEPGDGLADQCAAGPGQAGRFNDLQEALDSLGAGETLFVHPGDYFRSGAAFQVSGIGAAAQPIVITAADPSNPPRIHSWDPADPTNNASSHEALAGAEEPIAHVVIDHLAIDGLLAMHGERIRIQNVECTHGWEECDGNWSCIRLEWCDDCVVHHNFVHDVADTTSHCAGGPYAPREAGFKEFDCQRAIWEFNTVADTAQWGYDLHRSSASPVARFNLFRNAGPFVSIRMNRSSDMAAYGNVVLGGGACIAYIAEDPGDGFANLIDHNTCLFTGTGLALSPFSPTTVTNNIVGFLPPSDAESVNLVATPPEDGIAHAIDHNAYDASSRWVEVIYDGTYYDSIEAWRAATAYDGASIAAADTPCTFVDVPTDAADGSFDVSLDGSACATAGDSGGEIGACALGGCVGRACEACGGTVPGATGATTGAGAGGGTGSTAAASGGGAGGDGGAGDGGSVAENGDSGCSCATPPGTTERGHWILMALGLRVALRRRGALR